MMALSPLNSTCPSTSSLRCVFRPLAAQMVPLVLQVELVPEQAWCHSKQMQHLQLAKCPTRREKVNIVAGKAERTNPVTSTQDLCRRQCVWQIIHVAGSQTQRVKTEKAEHEGKPEYTC